MPTWQTLGRVALPLVTMVWPLQASAQHGVVSCSADGTHWDDSCSGGSGASQGRSFVAAPSRPTPAQQRRAAGVAAYNRGVAALNRPLTGTDISSRASEMLRNKKEAARDLQEALQYLPNDVNVRVSLANTKGVIAQFEGNYAEAVGYFEEALRYSPHNAAVRQNLKLARATLASNQQPNQIAYDEASKKAQAAEKAQDWDAAARYRAEVYRLCVAAKKADCDVDGAFAQYAMGRKQLAAGDWESSLKNLRAVQDFYQQKFSGGPDFGSLKEWKAEIDTALSIAEKQREREQAARAAAQSAKETEQAVDANCTGWMAQPNGSSFRLCTDDRAQRYCEQTDGRGPISRVSCQ